MNNPENHFRCAILHGGILAASTNYSIHPLRLLVPFEAFIFAIASRTENLYNLVLCITRAINVLFPVYQVNNTLIKAVLWLYPAIWVALVVNEIVVIESGSERVKDYMFSVVFLVINAQTGNEFLWKVYPQITQELSYVILLGIPFVLPAIITVICAVFICISLLRKTANRATQGLKRTITVTVLQLTVSSLLFSCLYFITELTLVFYNPDVRFFKHEYYLVYFTGNVSVFLNSVMKPMILVTRGTSLRQYLRSTLTLSKG